MKLFVVLKGRGLFWTRKVYETVHIYRNQHKTNNILPCRIWGRKVRNDHTDYFFSGFEEKMGQMKIIIDFLYLVWRNIKLFSV